MKITRLVFWFFITVSVSAQEQNKSQYHLFNPTPKELMRAMNTDRPDVTETPFTVDAGHYQFEVDFLNLYRHPISKNRKETDILFLNGIAKVGLLDYLDFELLFSAMQWHFPDTRTSLGTEANKIRRGFGDLGMRAKFNLLGNKHEEFGLAIMPSFLLPLNNNASEEVYVPGLTLIWAYSIGEKWELGGQLEYFRIYDLDGGFEFDEYWFTIEAGYDINDKYSLFVEYVSISSPANIYINTLNAGIIYEISPNFRIDTAFNLGLNQVSPSTVFTGFSCRF